MRKRASTTALLLLTTTVALAACGPGSEPPAAAPTVDAAGPSTPTPTPTPTASGAAESIRGNLPKKVGEVFGSTTPDGATQLASFRVTGISVDSACTGEYAEAPEHGHYVRIDIEGEMSPDAEFDMYFGGWRAIAENGTTFNGSVETGAAWVCLPDTERLPSMVGPGERVAGSIILDVPTASGVLVLPFDGTRGWEWEYPQ